MNKAIYLIILLLTACQPIQDNKAVIDDDIEVSQSLWQTEGNVTPYPFTVDYGNIACTMNEVYFFPTDTANDESQIGLPINRLAEISLRQDKMKPAVANTIKPNADLSEVVQIGLGVCKKAQL
ncbi:hypothetical protein [Psychrobacter sp. 72-O-c]|uniref:hypothetical protein n=1 Tax=Psychrobacter sp. 72-O-c TaxID=2774125 RepID=UPI001918071F|nr:hypothetical protein [Psychrobacter sp. 72-O-c]